MPQRSVRRICPCSVTQAMGCGSGLLTDYQKHFVPTQLISRGIRMQISVSELAVIHADVNPEEFCLHQCIFFFCNVTTFSIWLQANRGSYITETLMQSREMDLVAVSRKQLLVLLGILSSHCLRNSKRVFCCWHGCSFSRLCPAE